MEEIIEVGERKLSREEERELLSSWPKCPLCGRDVERWYVDENIGKCPVHGRIRLGVLEDLLGYTEESVNLDEHMTTKEAVREALE